MKFRDFVCFKAIVPELKATDRDGVIEELVSALISVKQLKGQNLRNVVRAVIKRENEASTGFGKGVAVPHVKLSSVNKFTAAIGRSSTGIDFASLDNQPVYSVILLVSPQNDPDRHLQIMEKIFRHLQQEKFRKFLRQSQSAEQIKDLLIESDEEPFS